MSKELDVAVKAAQEAGKILVKHFESRGGAKVKKGEADFVTEADHASEKAIISAIKGEFPGHSILAEESGNEDNSSEYRWIIDPLDGTKNFVWGIPIWAIGIALERKGQVIAAVSYAPYTGELFTAEKGKGAFLNGKRIHVSDRKFPDCMVAFGGSWAYEKEQLVKRNFLPVFEKFFSYYRIMGSAVYAMASIAAGNLDAYPCFSEKPWDAASGILLVQEAGGVVTDIYGNPPTANSKHFIFANSRSTYEEIRKVLQV
jgi:myo-inositol-1(or 4)-monophosphatase